MADLALFCVQENLPLVVTRTWDDPIPGVSTSEVHYGRAFDMSLVGWSQRHIDKMTSEFENKYKQVAAISASDGQKRLVIRHNAGAGDHCHFQVSEQSLYNRLSLVYKN